MGMDGGTAGIFQEPVEHSTTTVTRAIDEVLGRHLDLPHNTVTILGSGQSLISL